VVIVWCPMNGSFGKAAEADSMIDCATA